MSVGQATDAPYCRVVLRTLAVLDFLLKWCSTVVGTKDEETHEEPPCNLLALTVDEWRLHLFGDLLRSHKLDSQPRFLRWAVDSSAWTAFYGRGTCFG